MKRKNEIVDQTTTQGPSKRRVISDDRARGSFRHGLFEESVLKDYTEQYGLSEPYKHGVIPNLIDPTLLRNVRDEIRSNISFTPKETDIYKIHQSGDLANLDGLDESSLSALPSLQALRDAMYSAPFRSYLSTVTGSGPLSGSKTDMAVNVYTPGCHLLCHDDVIGSRRVSYILYLTDPDCPWKKEWGGALRLYPTEKMREEDGSEMKVPSARFSRVIPPAFNQLSFFAVQPGESFHDVEEVYAIQPPESIEEEGGRVRMAISGWFHIPQPGEHGYVEGEQEKQAEKSSLAQLQGKADKYDLPQPQWINHDEEDQTENEEGGVYLEEADLELLIQYMNPRYLMPDTVEELAQVFSDECSLRLGHFLKPKFEAPLRSAISQLDHSGDSSWQVARPPHKHRFLYHRVESPTPPAPMDGDGKALLHELLHKLFPSLSFKRWLCLATGLDLADCNVLARRFRRGLDYTLATSYDEPEPRLELCLGLTPTTGWGEDELDPDTEAGTKENGANGHSGANGEASSSAAADPIEASETSGGYEMYMVGDDGDDAASTTSDHGVAVPSSHTGAGKRREKADPAIYKSGGADEDDGVLFSMPACWNTLSIVLRDQGVLKFVKYVSRAAKGDRWDVVGEWKVEEDRKDDDGEDGDKDDENEEEDGEEEDAEEDGEEGGKDDGEEDEEDGDEK